MAADHSTVVTRRLRNEELPAAVAVLARGMRDNPGHVAAFGDDPERRRRSLQRLFSALFRVTQMQQLCAVHDNTITGVAAIAAPGTCRPTAWQKTQMASLLAPLGARRLTRLLAWQRVWRAHDPDQPHSHFGPLAVDAHVQGRGIGSQLMREYTRRLDAAGQLGYLETDKPENVVFYERHGFVVNGEAPVLGNPNWFMRREPRHP
jgi:GNAT superfamily N-acetyltransferase